MGRTPAIIKPKNANISCVTFSNALDGKKTRATVPAIAKTTRFRYNSPVGMIIFWVSVGGGILVYKFIESKFIRERTDANDGPALTRLYPTSITSDLNQRTSVLEAQIPSTRRQALAKHFGIDCPLCGHSLEIKTAKTGRNRGKRFLGCSTFPICRGTKAIAIGEHDDLKSKIDAFNFHADDSNDVDD